MKLFLIFYLTNWDINCKQSTSVFEATVKWNNVIFLPGRFKSEIRARFQFYHQKSHWNENPRIRFLFSTPLNLNTRVIYRQVPRHTFVPPGIFRFHISRDVSNSNSEGIIARKEKKIPAKKYFQQKYEKRVFFRGKWFLMNATRTNNSKIQFPVALQGRDGNAVTIFSFAVDSHFWVYSIRRSKWRPLCTLAQ